MNTSHVKEKRERREVGRRRRCSGLVSYTAMLVVDALKGTEAFLRGYCFIVLLNIVQMEPRELPWILKAVLFVFAACIFLRCRMLSAAVFSL